MPLFKKNQRYKVSRKSDFIQAVILLDGDRMECNLSVDCLPSDCLENVLQRLEVHEVRLNTKNKHQVHPHPHSFYGLSIGMQLVNHLYAVRDIGLNTACI